MEDRRTEVLCAGLLIKSPANSERKAAFARFWKLRWCVLQRITYIGSRNEGSKLAFCYYKSEEEFRNEKLPCGVLQIDRDTNIYSCYKSQAGFHHLFSIKRHGHKLMKLSAPSCQLKSRWIAVLIHYSSFCSPNDSPNRRRSSAGSKTSYDSGLKSRTNSQGSVDSTSSSIRRSDSRSSHGKTEGVLPEDARKLPRLSRTRSVLRFLETMIPALNRPAKSNEPENIGEGEDDDQEQQDLLVRRICSHVFMLCEACHGESNKGKGKSSLQRKGSSKKVNLEQHGNKEIETERSISRRRCSSDVLPFPDYSSQSGDSAFNDGDSEASVGERLYSMIDEKWLSAVHEIMKKKEGVDEAVGEGSDPNVENGVDYAGKNSDDEEEEDEQYMDMHILRDELNAIQLQEAETARSASEGAEAQMPQCTVRANLGFNSEYKSVVFEMNL